ncbi:putative transposase [Granulicella pectinivorans]|uniref:Putative transposase n=1 Tax=Granulicella pectinivorans TaxID=474950 RepID=A0A1I6MCE7_9BACT|nr:transposase [Granulicella pectinivorans]SFS13262.1 putative transposase [Granulicella pectinivorans]
MPRGLVRYQREHHLHFVTFSCHKRKPYLSTPSSRNLFEQSLEKIRIRYAFEIRGYVIMPEHVHLLMSEPPKIILGDAIKALKLSVSIQSEQTPFWLPRYYDFNVFTTKKRIEKLRYMHRNPVTRGLVTDPTEWPWSSYIYYATGLQRTVQIT